MKIQKEIIASFKSNSKHSTNADNQLNEWLV
jgi:hypothetical protein